MLIAGKLLFLLAFLLTILSCFSLQHTQPEVTAQSDTSNFLTYSSTKHRFTLQYPSGWILNDSDAGFTLHSPDMNAKIVVLASTNLTPEAIGMAKKMTLDQLVKSIFLPAQMFSLPEKELASFGINIHELNSDGYFLSGHAAGRMVWTYSDNKVTKMAGLATLVNNNLYGIVYLAETTKYNDYLQTVQKIIDSFRI